MDRLFFRNPRLVVLALVVVLAVRLSALVSSRAVASRARNIISTMS
jgi:hypothetical protein